LAPIGMRRHGGYAVRDASEVRLGPLDRIAVSVAPHQGATLMSLLADALGGRPQGLPQQWRRALRAVSPDSTPRVVGPLFTPAFSQVPDCLTMIGSLSDVDIEPLLADLADLPPDTLTAELEADFPGRVPAQWQPVVDDPRGFIAGYATVVRSLWAAFAPVWRQARPLLDREVERVGTAAVSGRLDTVLTGLSPRSRLDGDTLLVCDPNPMTTDLAGRRIALVPLVSGSRASVFSFDRADLVWIGYPLPGLAHLWSGQPPTGPSGDRLAMNPRAGPVTP
jgi:hypothetical protein